MGFWPIRARAGSYLYFNHRCTLCRPVADSLKSLFGPVNTFLDAPDFGTFEKRARGPNLQATSLTSYPDVKVLPISSFRATCFTQNFIAIASHRWCFERFSQVRRFFSPTMLISEQKLVQFESLNRSGYFSVMIRAFWHLYSFAQLFCSLLTSTFFQFCNLFLDGAVPLVLLLNF